ncbi:MAG: Glu/Leu/Phe/Val dehydrogenase dimerization domain-containing protein [Phycisphaerales bacterium]|jgi:leucine dehydrogenase|nr:Glu/Leu/Phe/Val dehydrogenase dimerization domain-containing protein [Phycisphaerales bacterium]
MDHRYPLFDELTQCGHEQLCFHHDPATGLRAIIAIHSTSLGNALGGTRRWYYESEESAIYDVLRLSRGMTRKAAAAGLPMGGAKSVILKSHRDQERTMAEARAMGHFVDTFNGAYIAAEDVGVDIQFIDWMAMETKHVMGGETLSRGGDPSPWTARGAFNGMRACLAHAGREESFEGLTVAIQGVGQVGRNLARMLNDAGASLIVSDIEKKKVDAMVEELGCTAVHPDDILTTECDILAPCALGAAINGGTVPHLRCGILCGAANNILDDPEEDAVALKTAGILYGPDFVVNAGGLIELAGLHLGMSREELNTRNDAIYDTTRSVLRDSETQESTFAAAVALADARISEGRQEQVHAG